MKCINSPKFPGKQDPAAFFADMRSCWARFNKMSPKITLSSMVVSSVALCALKDNPMLITFEVLQRDLKDADFDELEKRVVDYCYMHALHMEDPQKLRLNSIMASEVYGAPDSAFARGVSHHPSPCCTCGFVYHRFQEYPVLADVIRSGYAYKHGKIDPSWNLDNHSTDRHSSPG